MEVYANQHIKGANFKYKISQPKPMPSTSFNRFIYIFSGITDYNHKDIKKLVSLHKDDVKIIILLNEYDEYFEYNYIVMVGIKDLNEYMSIDVSMTKNKYMTYGSNGMYKFKLHCLLKSWHHVRESNVNYFRSEQVTKNEFKNPSKFKIKSTLKTPPNFKLMTVVNKDVLPKVYEGESFLPITKSIDEFKDKDLNKVWIFKPTGTFAFAGAGISVVSNKTQYQHAITKLTKMGMAHNAICQSYIDNPLLYKGKKMHLRYYLLVTSWGHFSSFKDVRIVHALKDYKNEQYDDEDIHDTHMKSTTNDRFLFSDLEEVYKGYKGDKSIKEFGTIIQKGLNDIRDVVGSKCSQHCYPHDESKKAYQVLGLDILVDQNLKVWLLEINKTPLGEGKNLDDSRSFYNDYISWELKVVGLV